MYWSGLPFPSPEDLPNLETEPGSPTLQTDALPSESPGKPLFIPFYSWDSFLGPPLFRATSQCDGKSARKGILVSDFQTWLPVLSQFLHFQTL